jgi:hypothetical protein
MKKATFVMVVVLAAAVFVAIGTATPIFETAFAQQDENTAYDIEDSCNGATSLARCGQADQHNVEGDNDVSGDINLG